MGAPSNRTATLESQMIPMIQDVPGQTLRARVAEKTDGVRNVILALAFGSLATSQKEPE